MKLYFKPFAGSLAARIAIEEAELYAEYVPVEQDRPLPDGRDFTTVSPMGYVPALETPAGFVLTESTAVLTYIAELAPEGMLAPPAFSDGHYRMLAWLNFIATELATRIYVPLIADAGPAERDAALARVERAFEVLSRHLATHEYLEGGFSVADAYLFTVLNWSEHAGVAIGEWPVLRRYRGRLRARPSIARAIAEEFPLHQAA